MSRDALKIAAIGDLAFNGIYHRVLARRGVDYPLRQVMPFWVDADLRLGNLESPLTSQPRVALSKFTLRASPLAVETVRAARIDCLCVANNHLMDFGPAGLLETCCKLEAVGIRPVGAGKSEAAAFAPAVLDIRGQRIGILAFCDVVQESPLYAERDTTGVARWKKEYCLHLIRELRLSVDWLIVHMHWGLELSQLPSPAQRDCAQAISTAGADLILGHHPHILQPIEIIGSTVVAYSLGNFVFSNSFWRGRNDQGEDFSSKYCLNPLTKRTGWLEVELQKGRPPNFRLAPALLDDNHCVVPDESPQRQVELRELARRLSVSDYENEFERERQLTDERVAWARNDRTLALRAELKLFHWGMIPWAVAES